MPVFSCTQFPESYSVDTRRSFRRGGFCWSCDYHIYLEKCREIVNPMFLEDSHASRLSRLQGSRLVCGKRRSWLYGMMILNNLGHPFHPSGH